MEMFPASFYIYQGQRFGTSKMHLSPPPSGGLGCCPFYGGGSVAADLLFGVLPIGCGALYLSVFGCA